MDVIRKAGPQDLSRIAEIFVFAKRVHYRAIIQNDALCFQELQVLPAVELFSRQMDTLWVYERGFVQGFVGLAGSGEIKQLFVDPLLEGRGVGGALLTFGVEAGGRFLWALEQNTCALRLYEKHGFVRTGEREPVEGTEAYALRFALNAEKTERG